MHLRNPTLQSPLNVMVFIRKKCGFCCKGGFTASNQFRLQISCWLTIKMDVTSFMKKVRVTLFA